MVKIEVIDGQTTTRSFASAIDGNFNEINNHCHGNITRNGCIGSASGKVLVTTTGGLITTADSLPTANNATCFGGQLPAYYEESLGTGTTNQFLRGDKTWVIPEFEPIITTGSTDSFYRGDKTWVTPDFEPSISTGTTSQYLRGDKTWVNLDYNSINLTGSQVANLLDSKPISHTIVNMDIISGNTTFDGSGGVVFRLTLTGDTTLQNPSNIQVGGVYQIEIVQDTNGLHVLSWDSNFKFPNGDVPVITLDGDAVDIITIYAKSQSELLVTYVQNFS